MSAPPPPLPPPLLLPVVPLGEETIYHNGREKSGSDRRGEDDVPPMTLLGEGVFSWGYNTTLSPFLR